MMERFLSRERRRSRGRKRPWNARRDRLGNQPGASQAWRLRAGRLARPWGLDHEEAEAQEGKIGLFDIKRG